MYLVDEENLHYYAYNHELISENLRIRATKKISIKFYKKYTNKNEIKRIVFTDIVLDYDNYIKYDNKQDYKERTKQEIEL